MPRMTREEFEEIRRRDAAALDAIKRKLADGLKLAAICSRAPCRRAQRCAGAGACLFDNKEWLRPLLLPACREALRQREGGES